MGERIDWASVGWERLAAGVGRVRLPGFDCTVGLVAGRGAALLVDAGGSPREGARLRAETDRLLGAAGGVTHLALTHAHFDHVLGAAAFAGAAVYGAAGLGAFLAQGGAELYADAVRHGTDRREAAAGVGTLTAVHHEVDGTAEGDGTRTLELGGGVRARLVAAGPGHTRYDLAVLVPGGPADPPVVFCGDLVEESGAPQAGPDAVPDRWPAALDRLLRLGGEDAVYVPGHGAAVDAAFVRWQRDALTARFGVSEPPGVS